jgi:hypothetical protein
MGLNVDAVAVVVDNHTGKVRAQFKGLGAEADAKSFLRQCQRPQRGGTKVDFLSSAAVITGDKAEKAIKQGRV